MLIFDWLVEALHLAHMISHLGYIYPIDKAQLGQPMRDDGTLYRLQVIPDASFNVTGLLTCSCCLDNQVLAITSSR